MAIIDCNGKGEITQVVQRQKKVFVLEKQVIREHM